LTTAAQAMVVGVFAQESQARRALDELRSAGFDIAPFGLAVRKEYMIPPSIRNELVRGGIPETDADYYDYALQSGRIVAIVQSDHGWQDIINVLHHNGAYDVLTGPVQVIDDSSTKETQTEGNRVLQLREEQLQVQKQQVETGHVLIRKRIITEEKTIKVPVSREEVVIERYPAADQSSVDPANENQPPIPDDVRILQLEAGQTIRIPIYEEQVVIEKRPVIIEELVISKQAVEEMRQVSATVQREEPRIEREGDVKVHDVGMKS
jgi:uncharacterized protein (TIGR02271 family)